MFDGQRVITALPPALATAAFATSGFAMWIRLRRGRFPALRDSLTQLGLSLMGGWSFGYLWLGAQRRNRDALMRMYNSTEIRQEFDFSESGAAPVDPSEYDKATGVNGEEVTRQLLKGPSCYRS